MARRREVELEDLRVAAHWAALHSTDPREDPGYVRGRPGGDRLITVGGEGTPKVRELCFHELGIARQTHALSARAVVADVLDLQHRLPLTWARVEALAADAFVARKVAAKTRELPLAVVGLVDVAVATVIGRVSPGRVLAIAEAAIIEADQAGHAERLEAERRRRYVGLSRTDEHGLRTVIARVTAGDAVWIDATVDRVADILADRPDLRPEAPGDDLTRDELRSLAFGWLARPAELLHLLLEAAHAADQAAAAADGPRRCRRRARGRETVRPRGRTSRERRSRRRHGSPKPTRSPSRSRRRGRRWTSPGPRRCRSGRWTCSAPPT